jgi:hypothetical protein
MQPTALRLRAGIIAGAILCLLFCCWVARTMDIPPVAGFDAALLSQPGAIVHIVIVAVCFLAGTLLVTLALGRWRAEAGLFCASVGLAVFSWRGGNIGATLHYAAGPSIFIRLMAELALLYVIVALGILGSLRLLGKPKLTDDSGDETSSWNHHLLAVAVQTIVMIVVMLLVAQNEYKKQAMAAVGISAFIGAVAAGYTFPVRRGFWLVIAPLLVGIIGYGLEFSKPFLLPIGMVEWGLATPLPLDYVAFGVAGGILGDWMVAKWKAEAAAADA